MGRAHRINTKLKKKKAYNKRKKGRIKALKAAAASKK